MSQGRRPVLPSGHKSNDAKRRQRVKFSFYHPEGHKVYSRRRKIKQMERKIRKLERRDKEKMIAALRRQIDIQEELINN